MLYLTIRPTRQNLPSDKTPNNMQQSDNNSNNTNKNTINTSNNATNTTTSLSPNNSTLPMCSEEVQVNCRCLEDGLEPKFNAEQAKVVFSCSVAALCLSMILFPYLLRYLSRKVQKNKQRKSQTNNSSSNQEGGEIDHHNDMPAWLCYRKFLKFLNESIIFLIQLEFKLFLYLNQNTKFQLF